MTKEEEDDKDKEKSIEYYSLNPKFVALMEYLEKEHPEWTRKELISKSADTYLKMKQLPNFESFFGVKEEEEK